MTVTSLLTDMARIFHFSLLLPFSVNLSPDTVYYGLLRWFSWIWKESPCSAGDWVQSLGWEDPLEKGMATHSSIHFFFYFWNAIIDRMEVYKWISKWNQCTQEGALTWDQLTMKTRSDGRRLKSKAEWGGKRKREEGPWDRVFKTCSADVFNFQVPEALVDGLGQTCYLVTKSSSRDRLYLEWGGRLEIWGDCRQSMTKRTEVWGCEH